ncbi:MAG: DNA polymerase III subunit delta [Patescibacteria group bacterium]
MIILLHGADTFRSKRFLRDLKNKFTKDVDPTENSLDFIDGQNTTIREINEKINTGSLFVKKRLVVVENIFKNKKDQIFTELDDLLKKIPSGENNIIIFWDEEINATDKSFKTNAKKLLTFLIQQPYSQEFKTLSDGQLLTFIKKEAATYHQEIDATAALRLLNLTSSDSWLIASEIKKLAFRSDHKIINLAAVNEMVTGSYDENIFGLTDALSAKNKKLALTLLEEQYAAGLSDEYLITMLIRQFKILWQIRDALDKKINPALLASQLKLHPFVVKKGLLQAKNFDSPSLKKYLNNLIRLDFLNKNSKADIKTELNLLIANL